jgi:hypothetical protein
MADPTHESRTPDKPKANLKWTKETGNRRQKIAQKSTEETTPYPCTEMRKPDLANMGSEDHHGPRGPPMADPIHESRTPDEPNANPEWAKETGNSRQKIAQKSIEETTPIMSNKEQGPFLGKGPPSVLRP